MLKLDSILEGIAELTGSRLANGSLLALPSSSLVEFPIPPPRGEGGGSRHIWSEDPRGSVLLRWRSSGFGNRCRLRNINRNRLMVTDAGVDDGREMGQV